MNFDLAAVTDVGNVRTSNEDRVLANGHLLADGKVGLNSQDSCRCFVADGVGGNQAGAFASNYVLEKLSLIPDLSQSNVEAYLRRINKDLLSLSNERSELVGSATTLTGLVINDDNFLVVHAGDSELWLLRNEIMFKVTNDHVLDALEKNSPITSFFGGKNDNLKFDRNITVERSAKGDFFLICSDGLFKSLDKKTVKTILVREGGVLDKADSLLRECLSRRAEDNVSFILIERNE